MKFLIAITLTAILAFVLGLYLPWWSIALAAFMVAAIVPQSPFKACLAGFLGLFLLWAVLAWLIDMSNQHILSRKMATILPLGGSSFMLVMLSAFVGALVAGAAGLSGNYFRKLIGQGD